MGLGNTHRTCLCKRLNILLLRFIKISIYKTSDCASDEIIPWYDDQSVSFGMQNEHTYIPTYLKWMTSFPETIQRVDVGFGWCVELHNNVEDVSVASNSVIQIPLACVNDQKKGKMPKSTRT